MGTRGRSRLPRRRPGGLLCRIAGRRASTRRYRPRNDKGIPALSTLRPLTRLVALCFVLAVSILPGTPAAPDQSPMVPTVPESDRRLLARVLGRLMTPENRDRMPVPVDDAARSLSGEIVRHLEGPTGSRYARAVVTISTRQAPWDSAPVQKSAQRPPTPAGLYTWRWNINRDPGSERQELHVRTENLLRLDTRYMAANERDEMGRILNEGLLYHELLHAQLLIDEMSGEAWRQRLCDEVKFDAAGCDNGHRRIHALEMTYLASRSGRLAVSVPAETCTKNGSFTVAVGSLSGKGNGKISMFFRAPASGNVDDLRITVDGTGAARKVLVKGTLKDPSRGGFFLARFRGMDEPPA